MEYSKDPIRYFLAPSRKRPTRERYYVRRINIPLEGEKLVDEDKLNTFFLFFSKKVQENYNRIMKKINPKVANILAFLFYKPDISDLTMSSKFIEIIENGKKKRARINLIKSGNNQAMFKFGKKKVMLYKLDKDEVEKNIPNAIYSALLFGVDTLVINTNKDITRYGFKKLEEGGDIEFQPYKMWINLSSGGLSKFLNRYF